MKNKIAGLYFFILAVAIFSHFAVSAQAGASPDRKAFYAALAGKDLAKLDEQLAIIKAGNSDNKEGYEGAILMRKAGLISGAAKKLKTFKAGKALLEAAIAKNSTNAELRFLRLLIQENAPDIVKYKGDTAKDREVIIQSYKNLPAALQSAIVAYSKKSNILKPGDLNQ